MQAIFPISMVVAVLAAIGIIFLLPSLLFPFAKMDVNVPRGQGLGHTLVANRDRTGAISSLNPNATHAIVQTPEGPVETTVTQAIVETPQGPVVANVILETPVKRGLPEINNSTRSWLANNNTLEQLERDFRNALYEKTGAYPRKHFKTSRKQRRSRRKNE